jgi:hypothetical protein
LSQLEHIEAIEKRLWAADDSLRVMHTELAGLDQEAVESAFGNSRRIQPKSAPFQGGLFHRVASPRAQSYNPPNKTLHASPRKHTLEGSLFLADLERGGISR